MKELIAQIQEEPTACRRAMIKARAVPAVAEINSTPIIHLLVLIEIGCLVARSIRSIAPDSSALGLRSGCLGEGRNDINLGQLMPPLLLYSVNCYFKFYVQERYRGNLHYVWVSESFDNGPPTSNPKGIYTSLKMAVAEEDEHDYKINEQKGLITARAIRWEADGEITSADKDEIVFSATNGAFKQWRPLIYIIPYARVAKRVETVPRHSRAGLSPEYRIADLKRSEFDIIEP